MLDIIILAAGMGKRMHSRLPKVLHEIAGKPLLAHVIQTAKQLAPRKIHIVYGHGGDLVRAAIQDDVHWVEQSQQQGTGHAVLQAMPFTEGADQVLVLYGDVPLIQIDTLQSMQRASAQVVVLTAILPDPTGLGRIIRDDQGCVVRIKEQKDATEKERLLSEVNTGIVLFPRALLLDCLGKISNNNAQKEYYLTDCIELSVQSGHVVHGLVAKDYRETWGINDRVQLADCERYCQEQQVKRFMLNGVTMRDPKRVDIRGDVHIASDVVLDINVILSGRVEIGSGCVIDANCQLKNVIMGEGCHIKANSVLEDAVLGNAISVGPFARIRPGTHIADNAQIGNFVEIKKSTIGVGSKIPHLSYIGDAILGSHVNIGAGTITCNYDGANKHVTQIEDDVFVGSDTQLVAPVRLGKGATIGAGTTVTKDVPAGKLALSRTAQKSIDGWIRPKKSNKEH